MMESYIHTTLFHKDGYDMFFNLKNQDQNPKEKEYDENELRYSNGVPIY